MPDPAYIEYRVSQNQLINRTTVVVWFVDKVLAQGKRVGAEGGLAIRYSWNNAACNKV
jgi:hypothetical protein